MPQSLFAKEIEREFVEGMAIKSITQNSLLVKTSHPAKVQRATQRTLFDVYLDEDRPLVEREFNRCARGECGVDTGQSNGHDDH